MGRTAWVVRLRPYTRKRRSSFPGSARPGDLGWVVMAHGELWAEEFGWATSFRGTVADWAGNHEVLHTRHVFRVNRENPANVGMAQSPRELRKSSAVLKCGPRDELL